MDAPKYITLDNRMKDITGQRFGRYVAIGPVGRDVDRSIMWECRCDCGIIRNVNGSNLRSGKSQSCGCGLNRETHGMHKSPEYKSWEAMKARCYNPSTNQYHDYGGRGITVCDRWINSFENYYADMGPRPSSGHSIDRKNNDLGYSPGNCRWADRSTQHNNTRSNINLTYNGKTQTMGQWAKDIGMNPETLRGRLKRGLSTREAIELPLRGKS